MLKVNKKLKEYIENSSQIVFFGGAGVSTESGIPDFRSKDGLYNQKDIQFEKYSPEYLLSRECLYHNPKVFFEFYRQKMDMRKFNPNVTHQFLAELEKSGKLIGIITQNIDGLHQKAGSQVVYEIHGTTQKNYCTKCGEKYDENFIFDSQDTIPKCPKCGGMVRPDVVLYGEQTKFDKEVKELLADADMLIVGGTSLQVYPANTYVYNFTGKHLVIINKENLEMNLGNQDLFIRSNLGDVFSEIGCEDNMLEKRDYKEEIIVHRMSPDVWKILQPLKTPEDWNQAMQPESLNSFLFQLIAQLEEQGVTDVGTVRICPADEEYLQNTQDINYETLYHYNPSEEDCRRILKKNGFDRNWDMFFLAGVSISKCQEVSLSDKTIAYIQKYLQNIFGEAHVRYSGSILKMYDEKYMNSGRMDFYKLRKVIEKEDPEECKTMQIQSLEFILIPFLVHGDVDEHIVDVEAFLDTSNVRNHPTEYECDFVGSGIQDMIMEDIEADQFVLCPYIQADFTLDDFCKEIKNAM